MTFKRRFSIGPVEVGEEKPAFIIAEAGVNHNGDIGLAKQLVVEAKRAGADCVKFQTFRARDLVTATAPKAEYQLKLTDPDESQFEMLRKLELSNEAHRELIALCEQIDVIFLSTPYSFADVDLLDELGAPAFKLASMHLTETPMIEYTARKGKPVILSTGMSTLDEVQAAASAFAASGNDALALLQCTTDYPATIDEANLRAMRVMETATGAVIGYSDNSDRTDISVFAAAAGAKIIEKHITLDKTLPGPDHAASADPLEFKRMVADIRNAERALGSAEKKMTVQERGNVTAMRRSLVAVVDLKKGDTIAAETLALKRPATGILPRRLPEVIGKKTKRDISAGTILTEEMVVW